MAAARIARRRLLNAEAAAEAARQARLAEIQELEELSAAADAGEAGGKLGTVAGKLLEEEGGGGRKKSDEGQEVQTKEGGINQVRSYIRWRALVVSSRKFSRVLNYFNSQYLPCYPPFL